MCLRRAAASMRSRAVSLPALCSRSRRSGPPPASASALRRRSSAMAFCSAAPCRGGFCRGGFRFARLGSRLLGGFLWELLLRAMEARVWRAGILPQGRGEKVRKGFRRLRRCDWKGANLEIGVPGKGGSAGRQAGSSVLCGWVRLGREMRNTVYVSARVCVSGRRTSCRRLRWSCLDLPDRI